MKILIAGSPTRDVDKCCRRWEVGKLYSILNEKKAIESWDFGQFLMVDSGAHSWNKMSDAMGHVGMASAKKLPPIKDHAKMYMSFIEKHKDKGLVFVELDCYDALSKDFIDGMYRDIKSIKGSFEFIRVYHRMIDSDSLSVLNSWIDEGQDYIGLGLDAMPLYDKIFYRTRGTVKYHGFALTQRAVIEKYPFYSVDSSTPISTVIFGNYLEKYLKSVGKDKLVDTKDFRVKKNDHERIEEAVMNVKHCEQYVTKLWEKRGVIWK